jgi:hypothetical protein
VLTFEDMKMTEAEVDEGNEEVIRLSEPEIDFETDPFQSDSVKKPGKDWKIEFEESKPDNQNLRAQSSRSSESVKYSAS